MIVVDASVAVKWFVAEDGHLSALRLLEQGLNITAPDLIFPETANVLWKKLRRREVTSEQVQRASRALPDFFQGILSSAFLIEDALKFAELLGHPVYDCIYLSCAQQQGAKLVTADQKFVSILRDYRLNHLVVALDEAPTLTTNGPGGGLAISDAELNRITGLSDQFRRTLSFVEAQVGAPMGEGRLRWVAAADLAPAIESPARRRLEQAIVALSLDSMCDLVALAWLGRGSDGNDWALLREQATRVLGEDPSKHVGYMISLLKYVQDGLQRINDFHAQTLDQSDPDPKLET